jgi:hypothetical protein
MKVNPRTGRLILYWLITIFLFACRPAGPYISIFTADTNPKIIHQVGDQVTFRIGYSNASSDQTYELDLELQYPQGMTFVSATPEPLRVDDSARKVRWYLGTTKPENGGTVNVQVRVASVERPTQSDRLVATCVLYDRTNGSQMYVRSLDILIAGVPTWTPTPQPTASQLTSSLTRTPAPISTETPIPPQTAPAQLTGSPTPTLVPISLWAPIAANLGNCLLFAGGLSGLLLIGILVVLVVSLLRRRKKRDSSAPMPTAGSACPNCGAALHTGQGFCSRCGFVVADRGTCPRCGARRAGNEKLCGECGQSFD